MAGEISSLDTADYGLVRHRSLFLFANNITEAWQAPPDTAALLGECAVGLTSFPDLGRSVGDLPAWIGAGQWEVWTYTQAGLAPAVGDVCVERVLAGQPVLNIYGSTGSVTFTYVVYDTDGETPLAGVAVYVSSDALGVNRSEVQLSDSLGRTVWQLDPGAAWFWRRRFDRTFSDPDMETVDA